jgi:hypothetical protein
MLAGQIGGRAGDAVRSRWPVGAIPRLGRCGTRGQDSQPCTRAASGLPSGLLGAPARSWLTSRPRSGLDEKAGPGVVRKMPRWSAGRRGALRHWAPAPARRDRLVGRLSALRHPSEYPRGKERPANPAPHQTTGAAKLCCLTVASERIGKRHRGDDEVVPGNLPIFGNLASNPACYSPLLRAIA